MNKNMLIFGGVIIAALIGFTVIQSGSGAKESSVSDSDSSETSMIEDDHTGSDVTGEALGVASDRFVDYSEANFAKASTDGRAVMFFHASWCPTCKAAEKELNSSLDEIPEDVTILKTDYDTQIELKTKYGIVMQDTFVQVDEEGNELTKWNSGGRAIDTLLDNIKEI